MAREELQLREANDDEDAPLDLADAEGEGQQTGDGEDEREVESVDQAGAERLAKRARHSDLSA